MIKFFSIAAVLTFMSAATMAQNIDSEAICGAAGIGAGNISNYKAAVFDQKPQETMQVITSAKASLARQYGYIREKVDLTVINAASPNSWASVQAALLEFNKLCPCGGQSPRAAR